MSTDIAVDIAVNITYGVNMIRMDYEVSFFVNLVRWTSAVNIFVYFYFHLLLNSLKEQTADIPRILWYCASTVHHFKSLFNVFLTFEGFSPSFSDHKQNCWLYPIFFSYIMNSNK